MLFSSNRGGSIEFKCGKWLSEFSGPFYQVIPGFNLGCSRIPIFPTTSDEMELARNAIARIMTEVLGRSGAKVGASVSAVATAGTGHHGANVARL